MIVLDHVSFSYDGRPFIRDFSLQIKEGELHGIIGPNGAGKSTLLRLMGGLLDPQSGSVMVDSRPYSGLPAIERAKTVAYVFQENYTGFPFTVEEMVLLGRHPHQAGSFRDTPEDRRIALDKLDMLGMAGFRRRLFRSLSGGEKQRVAVAAALAQETPVLLFDEPTAFTDLKYQSEIYRLIHAIARSQKLTTVVITHDINLASLYCDIISVIRKGGLLATGKPADILSEALLADAYDTQVRIIRHPDEGVPVVLPLIR